MTDRPVRRRFQLPIDLLVLLLALALLSLGLFLIYVFGVAAVRSMF